MGKKNSTSTSQVTVPPEVLARYNAVNTRAETAAAVPFQGYGTQASDFVAQINPQQTAGINSINAAAGSYRPYFDKASNLLDTSTTSGMAGTSSAYDATGKAVSSYDPYLTAATGATASGMGPAYAGINNYMSPYIQSVADTTGAMMRQANEQAQSGALGTAASSGAFGGDRAGIAAANLANQQGMAYGKTMADIYNQGYTQALGASQADLARLMQGGQQLSNLGLSGANLGLTGAAQQANLAQQGYNIGSGSAAATANLGAQGQALGLQGGQAQLAAGTMQQQTEQAGKDALINQFMQEKGYPFQVAQFLANIAMGTGAASGSTTTAVQPASFFSDRRLKEDVERIGEGDNGLPIYKYRYKGEPETHIGFMADEVEKVRPDAVGTHPTGYKTVDYDRATKAGGGGVAGPYGAIASPQPGLGSYVPEGYLPQYELMIADPSHLENARQSFAQQLEAAANLGNSVKDIEGNWQYWSNKWGSDPEKEAVAQGARSSGVAGHYASGGSAYTRPISADMGARSYLSDVLDAQSNQDNKSSGLQPPAQIPQGRTTGEDLADIAKLAMKLFGMNRGGRTGYATRGGVSDEDLRRLREMEEGAATNLLPSGAVPGPSRISRPVTYYPQAPSWKTSPKGDYQYDTNFGMVRDVSTGQPISNARYAVRNSGAGLPVAQINARDDAIENIDKQIQQSRADAFSAAEEARRRFESRAEFASGSGSYQDPKMQFPREYGAYQDALNRYNSANATVMPSSVTNRFGNQANYMIADAYRPEVGMVSGVMPRPADADTPILLPDDAPAPGLSGAAFLPSPSGSMTSPAAEIQPAALGFSGLRPAEITDAPISSGSMRPRPRPAGLVPEAVAAPATGLRPRPRPADLMDRYAPSLSGVGGGGADRMPVIPTATGVVTPTAADTAAPQVTADGLTVVPVSDTTITGLKPPAAITPRADVSGMDPSEFYRTQILRQESGHRQFGPDGKPLTSSAGAVGIGQVMEGTGPEAAKLAGLPWDRDRWLYDEKYNAAIGEAYFLEQYRKYGSLDKAAAAYNAGPGALESAMDRSLVNGGSYLNYLPAETQKYVAATAGGTGVGGGAVTLGDRTFDQITNRMEAPGGLKPYDERNVLGQMMYDPDTNKLSRNALLSLASGVGSMLSSPSQFFLPSLGLGLQGAAGTYAGLEKQAADIGQTKAQTLETQVRTDASRFFTIGPNGMPMVVLGPNQTVTLSEYLQNPQMFSTGNPSLDAKIEEEAKRKAAEGFGGEQPSTGAGGNTPTGVRWGQASQDALARANQAVRTPSGSMNFSVNSQAVNELVNGSTIESTEAVLAKPNSNELAYTVAGAIGAGDMGSVQGYLANSVVAPLNAVLRQIGVEPFLETDDRAIILRKLGSLNAASLTPEQQRAASVYQQFVDVSPDLTMTPQAAAAITSSLMLTNQQAIDKANYYQAFQGAADAGFPPNYMTQGYAGDYSNLHQIEKGNLNDLFLMASDEDKGETVKKFLSAANSGLLTQEKAQEILNYILGTENTSQALARYFITGM